VQGQVAFNQFKINHSWNQRGQVLTYPVKIFKKSYNKQMVVNKNI
jgi:hypothetical protein